MRKFLARLRLEQSGATIIWLAMVMPAALGLVGLGFEAGMWFYNKRDLQTQADAAAFSAAYAVASGNGANMEQIATAEATRNGLQSAGGATIAFNRPPTSGPQAGNNQAVEVVLTLQPPLLLSSVFHDSVTIVARSVARVQVVGEACILALHPTASRAVFSQGSSTVNLANCIVAANSSHATAIDVMGNTDLTAETLWTVGGYNVGGSGTLTVNREPVTNAWALADPYVDLTIPTSLPCDYNNTRFNNTTQTISPGVYCNGIDFRANSNITLQPGTYYINRGDLTINAQATVRCNCSPGGPGVTIVLTSTGPTNQIGTVRINGNSDVVLRAPGSGSSPYLGVLLFQDRRATPGQVNRFNGNSTMSLAGALYFPSQDVDWSGNNGTAAPSCTRIIAQTITFTGNSKVIDDTCAAEGTAPINVTAARFSD